MIFQHVQKMCQNYDAVGYIAYSQLGRTALDNNANIKEVFLLPSLFLLLHAYIMFVF